MPYEALRRTVCRANRELAATGLIALTFGNVSGVDRRAGVLAIKPSGVAYADLRPADMVGVSLRSGRVVAGRLRPSSDTPTHLHLYRSFPDVGGIVHSHSLYATSWAQAGRPLPCFGTTHADQFHGPVPVTRALTAAEIRGAYEHNTGVVIAEHFRKSRLDPHHMPAALVPGHGPFVWGATVAAAVDNAVALEAVARMALYALQLRPGLRPIAPALLDKHFLRKHGAAAYYGQKG